MRLCQKYSLLATATYLALSTTKASASMAATPNNNIYPSYSNGGKSQSSSSMTGRDSGDGSDGDTSGFAPSSDDDDSDDMLLSSEDDDDDDDDDEYMDADGDSDTDEVARMDELQLQQESIIESSSTTTTGRGIGREGQMPMQTQMHTNGHNLSSQGAGQSPKGEEYELDDPTSSSSQPLQTLKKLQAMLEDTDYATTATASNSKSVGQTNGNNVNYNHQGQGNGGNYSSSTTSSRGNSKRPDLMHSQAASSVVPPPNNAAEDARRRVPPSHSPRQPSQRQTPQKYTQQQQQQKQQQENVLWTSKDRSKYKKQRRLQRERERQRLIEQQQQQQQFSMSDDDSTATDMTDDTDDGLGYTLPNLPVYFSDAESAEDESQFDTSDSGSGHIVGGSGPLQIQQPRPIATNINQSQSTGTQPLMNSNVGQNQNLSRNYNQKMSQQQIPPQQQGQGHPYLYQNPAIQNQPNPQQQQQQQQQYQYPQMSQQGPQSQQGQYQYPQQQGPNPYNNNYPYPPPYMYNPHPNAYNNMNPNPQYMHQYQGWNPNMNPSSGYAIPYPQPQQYYQSGRSYQQPVAALTPPASIINTKSLSSGMKSIDKNSSSKASEGLNIVTRDESTAQLISPDRGSKVNEDGRRFIAFDTIQKVVFFVMGQLILCYCAVSPRTLDVAEYNIEFRKNARIVASGFIVPIIMTLGVVDTKECDFNELIGTFYISATLGYFLAFILEIIVTSVIRLGVFLIWEPSIFELTPTVPLIILPFSLREQQYRPKRITLFVADFMTTCLAAPVIEEYMKLKVVQLSTQLPRNFRRKIKLDNSSKNKRKKRRKKYKHVMEPIERAPSQAQVVNINRYTSHMLAASLGMKMCDSTRRVLMYTKHDDMHKSFYAFFRGFFPIHELCGSMTALELAKRDVLGLNIPLWRILLPAVFIHGMANLKGMKPIFKWNAGAPWSEIQMSPWWVADYSNLSQVVKNGLPKVMWFIIMARVGGYCIKNYYMVGRQAVKRSTTFAGKNAAFNAELQAAEVLKKFKKEKK